MMLMVSLYLSADFFLDKEFSKTLILPFANLEKTLPVIFIRATSRILLLSSVENLLFFPKNELIFHRQSFQ